MKEIIQSDGLIDSPLNQNYYSKFSTEELMKMRETAYEEYYRLAATPITNPSQKDLEPLEKATAKLEAIREELSARKQSLNKQIQSASGLAAESHSSDKTPAKEPLEFVFDDEIEMSDDSQSLEGYVWATDSLVARLKAQEPPLEEDQFMENINFYPVYNMNSGTVSLEGHYYLEDGHYATGKAFALPLTPDESNRLREAFEAYCLKREGMSCLEFLRDMQSEHYSVLNQELVRMTKNNQPNEMLRLIQEGADVNYKDKFGVPVLQWATNHANSHTIELLVERGADVNAQDKTGKTKLMLMASYGDKDIVSYLLEHGANACLKDQDDRDALSFAKKSLSSFVDCSETKRNAYENVIGLLEKAMLHENKKMSLSDQIQSASNCPANSCSADKGSVKNSHER